MAEDKMRDVVYGLALESHEKEQEMKLLREHITELEQIVEEFKQGEWVWADIYGPCKDHPENPNIACFSRVWLSKDDEEGKVVTFIVRDDEKISDAFARHLETGGL